MKHKKQALLKGGEIFNKDPEEGFLFLRETGILKTPLDPIEVASFLR